MQREPGMAMAAYDDEIDLKELLRALWAGRWLVLLSGLAATFLGVAIALYLPNEYRVSATLAAPETNGKGGFSALAGNLGGLAAMAGISLPGAGGNTAVAMAELQSNRLLTAFINEQGLKPLLFADRWDVERGEWLPRPAPGLLKRGLMTLIKDPYQDSVRLRASLEPTDAEAVELFRKDMLSVSQDKKTELVTVSLTWSDPVQAAAWLQELVRRLNIHTRQRMMDDAEKSITHLQEELMRTQEVGVRQSIYGLMEAKLNGRMMAAVTEEVAFRVIDPPVIPSEPSSPRRALIVLLAGLLGGLLASALVLLRQQWNEAEGNA